jgi:bifunctional oligoribonuclease and PAP phosphatase NrnA
MRGTESWDPLRQVIAQADRFFLTSHVFPEGDALGSEVALAIHLQSLGKQVMVMNDGPALDRYGFLTRLFPVHSWDNHGSWPDPGWVQVAICLDVSNWDYLGGVGRWLKAARPRIVSIDHHHHNGPFGDLDILVEDASSTGEILYRYFRAVDAPVTVKMAEALYASILFDTWGLRLPNCGNETVRLAAEILGHGISHRRICADLFEGDSLAKFDLLRLALQTLRSACAGRLAWVAITEDLFRATDTRFSDGDGILDHLLSLREVEICAMFRQQENRGVKVTFRSKGRHDVGRLAEELGGGGRGTASGVLLPVSIHEAMESVLPRLHDMLGEIVVEDSCVGGGAPFLISKVSRAAG